MIPTRSALLVVSTCLILLALSLWANINHTGFGIAVSSHLIIATVALLAFIWHGRRLVLLDKRYRQAEEALQVFQANSTEMTCAGLGDAALEEAGELAKASFITNMSHEIRTPMNAIIGFAELAMEDKSLSSVTAKHMGMTVDSAKDLLAILNDILDVSKLKSGNFVLDDVCFHLANAMADVLRLMEAKASQKKLNLNIEYHASLPSYFRGDVHRIRQIIRNLVGNAIKFSDNGEVTVTIQPAETSGLLHFIVKDTGIGMTEAQVARVFQSFTQADETTTRRFGGLGLGAAIAKQIVALMGGEIWVESEVGQGSTFHFTASLQATEEEADCLFFSNESRMEEYISPRLFKVLLAEDIKVNADLVRLRLKQQGHILHWVEDGRQAVDESGRAPYDLILMDIFMPELDGLAATQEIRVREQGGADRLPILALTASVLEEDQQRCYKVGMDGVVTKPVDFVELLTAMEKVVPEGQGRLRTSHHINILPGNHDEIDFSAFAGVIDYGKALENWPTGRVYLKSLVGFASDKANNAAEIKALLGGGDGGVDQARALSHSLKGVAATLAIDEVTLFSTKINDAIKNGDIKAALAEIPFLEQALAAAVQVIDLVNSSGSHEKIETLQAFDPAVVQGLLTELAAALTELNPDGCEPLLKSLATYQPKAALLPIQQAIDVFDFEAAELRLAELRSELNLAGGHDAC